MAEPTFDRARFTASLRTRRLGRTLIVHAETASTNDDAWDAAMADAPDGTVVVADHQTHGRGRDGRAWHDRAGRGLAMSVLLFPSCEPHALGTAPLVAGLALAEGLATLGVATDLKWPNDLLAFGHKLAGVLCERRRLASGTEALVIGVGVNVGPGAEDVPLERGARATSLTRLGHAVTREDVAAAFLDAFEPRWDAHAEGDPRAALDAWRARARFWGETLTARTPGGEITGVAEALDDDGALALRTPAGARIRIVAGDVVAAASAGRS